MDPFPKVRQRIIGAALTLLVTVILLFCCISGAVIALTRPIPDDMGFYLTFYILVIVQGCITMAYAIVSYLADLDYENIINTTRQNIHPAYALAIREGRAAVISAYPKFFIDNLITFSDLFNHLEKIEHAEKVAL